MRASQLQRSAVSETQLRDALAAVRGRTLFFVDTCYDSRVIGNLDRHETVRLANGLSQSEMGVIVFSGSAPRQESLESAAWGNGGGEPAIAKVRQLRSGDHSPPPAASDPTRRRTYLDGVIPPSVPASLAHVGASPERPPRLDVPGLTGGGGLSPTGC